MSQPARRSRVEIWTEMGLHDGYDGKFRPPKFGNHDCLDAYLAGWGAGTTAAIKDTEKTEKIK